MSRKRPAEDMDTPEGRRVRARRSNKDGLGTTNSRIPSDALDYLCVFRFRVVASWDCTLIETYTITTCDVEVKPSGTYLSRQ